MRGLIAELLCFQKGTTPNLRIEFVPTATTKTLETAVRAKLAGGVIVSFNLDEKDPCKGGNLTCPLKEGETYFYQQGVTILQEYPKAYYITFFEIVYYMGK
ncbi:BMA-HEH-1 [Dirofilaria immitis]|nr:BMA-HEH-1 [Dirofilaria immitis]